MHFLTVTKMRKFLITNLLLFFPVITQALILKWVDENDRCIYRIDTQKKILEKETKADTWQVVGNIGLLNIDEREMLQSNKPICLFSSNKNLRYLLIDCTNQVYTFNFKTMSLERIDKTYYRGYNCESVRFIRKDTLYSSGGYGCFRTNNLLTYFQNETKEWDSFVFSNDAPKSIFKGLNGYLEKSDLFISGLNYHYSDSENQGKVITDFGMYEYSFRTGKWNKLGTIRNTLLKKISSDTNRSFHWNGQYFVIRIYEDTFNKIYIIDPLKNEIFEWKDKKRLFDSGIPHLVKEHEKEHIIGDSLYSYKAVITKNPNYIAKHVFSLEQLKKEGKFVGKVYESSNINYWILSGIIATIIASVFFYVRKSKSKKETPLLSDKLDESEKMLLNVLIGHHNEQGVDTEQINTLLQINNKTIENQRKVRHDFIKALTQKLALIYGIEEPIEKIPSSIDKRIFNYKLNDNLYKKLGNKTNIST